MKNKIDFALTLVLILFGVLYTILTFTLYVLPGKLSLETMYFPAIALMYIFTGLFNFVRLKIEHQLIIKTSVVVNLLLLIYAAYLTCLVRVAVPPYIATSVLAVVFIFSLSDLHQKKLVEVKA